MKIYSIYFLTEMIRAFFLGVVVFISIICMMQFLQITEIVLVHGVPLLEVLAILGLMAVSFLPIVMPMSLLFSVLLTYTRMSGDSEIVAFNAIGYSSRRLAMPAILFSIVVAGISFQTLSVIGPEARLKFDHKMQQIGGQKIIEALQPRMFIEDFFNMVFYFNDFGDNKEMQDVFIRDARNTKSPMIILAKTGVVETSKDTAHQLASIQLFDGKAIETVAGQERSIAFEKYQLSIASPIQALKEDRGLNTFSLTELSDYMKSMSAENNLYTKALIEWHKRVAISFACVIFGFLGTALGSTVNRRTASSKGFIMSVLCIVVYWVMFAGSSSIAESNPSYAALMLWGPNILFSVFALYLWKQLILR